MKVRYKKTEGKLLALYQDKGYWNLNIETERETALGKATESFTGLNEEEKNEIEYL